VFRQDYLMRLVQQLAEAIRRISGLNRSGHHDAALAAADQQWGELLDAPRALIDAVDTPTLAAMLRDPAKLRAAAKLCHEEGRALAGKDCPAHAQRRYRRALELMLELRAAGPARARGAPEGVGEHDDDAVILELSRLVPSSLLAPRYRTALPGPAADRGSGNPRCDHGQ